MLSSAHAAWLLRPWLLRVGLGLLVAGRPAAGGTARAVGGATEAVGGTTGATTGAAGMAGSAGTTGTVVVLVLMTMGMAVVVVVVERGADARAAPAVVPAGASADRMGRVLGPRSPLAAAGRGGVEVVAGAGMGAPTGLAGVGAAACLVADARPAAVSAAAWAGWQKKEPQGYSLRLGAGHAAEQRQKPRKACSCHPANCISSAQASTPTCTSGSANRL